MKIFVRALPQDTSPLSLQDFAEHILTPPWYLPLRKKIRVKSCVVLKIQDLDLNTTEFHGLLEVTPYKAAKEAITLLNQRRFHGRFLTARIWRDRSESYGLRPIGGSEEIPSATGEERRRPRLVIQRYVPPDFQGLRQFHREFG